jgi:hypothetical protein
MQGSTARRDFSGHPTVTYVRKVRDVRFPIPDVGLLHAVVGRVPPGHTNVNPNVNATQSLVPVRASTKGLVTFFQNAPVAFHGHRELSQQLTDKLSEVFGES